MIRKIMIRLVLIVALVAGLAAAASFDAERQSEPPHAAPPKAEASAPLTLAAVGGDSTAALEFEFAAFIEGVNREAERVAAEEAASMAAAQRRSTGGATPAGVPGQCDGVNWAIPVQLVIRESKCNFDAQSPPSFCGGYGCVGAYQFDSRHWDPNSWGGCADLGDWHDPEAQHECARRLSHDGTRLSPWGG